MFELTSVNKYGKPCTYYYDLQNNKILDQNKKVLSYPIELQNNIKGHNYLLTRTVIRIFVGRNCNFSCKYCVQKSFDKPEFPDYNKENFVKKIVKIIGDNSKNTVIQLWGGEPYLYFNEMIEFVSLFKKLCLDTPKFYTSTNGSFFGNKEIRDWTLNNIDFLQISYDGESQYLRDGDPLKDKDVIDLIKQRSNLNKVTSFNTVLTKFNHNLYTYRDLITEQLGNKTKFIIAAARFLLPINEGDDEYCLLDEKELQSYCKQKQEIILFNKIPQWLQPTHETIQFLFRQLNNQNVYDYCPSMKDNAFHIDYQGNLLQCANTEKFKYKTIDDVILEGKKPIKIPSNFQKRLDTICTNCIVKYICMGGCPLANSYFDSYCKTKFAESLPILSNALFLLTGTYLIDFKRVE